MPTSTQVFSRVLRFGATATDIDIYIGQSLGEVELMFRVVGDEFQIARLRDQLALTDQSDWKQLPEDSHDATFNLAIRIREWLNSRTPNPNRAGYERRRGECEYGVAVHMVDDCRVVIFEPYPCESAP